MADPLSIAASCIAVIGAAGKTGSAILTFIKGCREARTDLTTISRELTDLQITLEILKDDGEGDALPSPLCLQIVSMVGNCGRVISDIDNVLARHKGRRGALRWAVDGKRDVEGLKGGLKSYRESLSLTVEVVTLSLVKSIKNDTEAIRRQTSAIPYIKNNTERILDGIEDLRIAILPREEQAWSKKALLDDYLDGLTSYTESVCEEAIWKSEIDDDDEEATTIGDMDEYNVRRSQRESVKETQQSETRDEPAEEEASRDVKHNGKKKPNAIAPPIPKKQDQEGNELPPTMQRRIFYSDEYAADPRDRGRTRPHCPCNDCNPRLSIADNDGEAPQLSHEYPYSAPPCIAFDTLRPVGLKSVMRIIAVLREKDQAE